ncbi:MAG: DUF1549 domain-containing protein, partial [Verrucomicrobiota bacterium]
MNHDRLDELTQRFEAGLASDAEWKELEELLASDHEARERFLDHAQLEGILRGLGEEEKAGAVIPMRAVPVESAAPRRNWKWMAAVILVAAAILSLVVGKTGREETMDAVTDLVELKQFPNPLTAEERYDRSILSDMGGATQAHPETATNGEFAAHATKIEFNRDIRPILSDKCIFCHGPDAAERKADLRLDTEEGAMRDLGGYAAIVRGDVEASELVARIHDDDPDMVMPPPESSRRLTPEEKELLGRWIEQGAAWQQHWSFEMPERRELPSLNDEAWAINEIDHFVLACLEEKEMEPSPEASRETWIRRVSLDLTGLPPSVPEVDSFLADASPEAHEKVVDRLLRTPAHAERMAWTWMEAARYADTDGYQNDGPRDMWRWRDWVIDAYSENMPFDQFSIEQLAGDLLEEPNRDQLIATG